MADDGQTSPQSPGEELCVVVVGSDGQIRTAIPAFDAMPGMEACRHRPLQMTPAQLARIGENEDYIENVCLWLEEHPAFFHGEAEYDVYPLWMVWLASEVGRSGVLTLLDTNSGRQCLSYLSAAPDPVDRGDANLFEDIGLNLPSLAAQHPFRPLILTGISNGDDDLHAAARLSFAQVFFGMSGR